MTSCSVRMKPAREGGNKIMEERSQRDEEEGVGWGWGGGRGRKWLPSPKALLI